MSFTDDDLKRLKKIQAHQPYLLGDLERIMSLQVPALLSRLEAAEQVISVIEKESLDGTVFHATREEWLKSKGQSCTEEGR